MKRDIPFEIAAGASADLECSLKTVQPGPFESQIHLYLDDLGLREIIITVHGTAGQPESRSAD